MVDIGVGVLPRRRERERSIRLRGHPARMKGAARP